MSMNPINLKKQEVFNKINLRKEELNKIVLTKKELITLKARILLCIDMSGSMENNFRNGKIQDLIERIIPLAMSFDDDGILEIMLFDNSAKYIDGVSVDDVHDFVKDVLLKHCTFKGTNYAPFINMISNKVLYDYYFNNNGATTSGDNTQTELVSLWSWLKSKFNGDIKKNTEEFEQRFIYPEYKNYIKNTNNKKEKVPVYMLVITDGDNSDRTQTDKAITEASHLPIFFQFCGIGNSKFKYLEKLDTMNGRFIDNANFLKVTDIDKFSNKELYEKLLQEFPSWIELAKEKGLID